MDRWLTGWIFVGLIMLAVGVAQLIQADRHQRDGAQAVEAEKYSLLDAGGTVEASSPSVSDLYEPDSEEETVISVSPIYNVPGHKDYISPFVTALEEKTIGKGKDLLIDHYEPVTFSYIEIREDDDTVFNVSESGKITGEGGRYIGQLNERERKLFMKAWR